MSEKLAELRRQLRNAQAREARSMRAYIKTNRTMHWVDSVDHHIEVNRLTAEIKIEREKENAK